MHCVNGHCKPLIPGSTQSSQLCDLRREFIRLQLIDSTFANSSGRQFWWKRYVTLHLGDQGCGLHRAKLPERASIVSECYYIKCPRRHCVVAGWTYSCVANSQICKDANRQRLIDVKLTTAKRRRMHRMATIECRRSLRSEEHTSELQSLR